MPAASRHVPIPPALAGRAVTPALTPLPRTWGLRIADAIALGNLTRLVRRR
jgi:hypothetical protein